MVHAQRKGKLGEKQFCEWLGKHFGLEVERNYNQADGESSDIVIGDFFFEVKRREKHSLPDYWHQTVRQRKGRKGKGRIPVVAFRSNRQPWRFLLPAFLLMPKMKGFMLLEEGVMINYLREMGVGHRE